MKKTISLVIVALLLVGMIPMVLAADSTQTQLLTAEPTKDLKTTDQQVTEPEPVVISPIETGDGNTTTTEDIGATPDEPIRYWFKRMGEGLKVAFEADRTKKAELRLQFAEKRIEEVKKMISENKDKAAEKAQKLHERLMDKVQKDVEKIKENGSEKELEKVVGLDRAVQAHEAHIAKFQEKISNMNLTEAQKAKFEQIIGNFQNKTNMLKEKITERKNRVENKIRAEKDGNATQIIEQVQKKVREHVGTDEEGSVMKKERT